MTRIVAWKLGLVMGLLLGAAGCQSFQPLPAGSPHALIQWDRITSPFGPQDKKITLCAIDGETVDMDNGWRYMRKRGLWDYINQHRLCGIVVTAGKHTFEARVSSPAHLTAQSREGSTATALQTLGFEAAGGHTYFIRARSAAGPGATVVVEDRATGKLVVGN